MATSYDCSPSKPAQSWARPSVVPLVVNITTLKTKKLKWANPPTCIPKFALYISRPFLHVDHCVNSVNINFTLNLTQGVFIDRIYRINHTETWNFNALTLVTSVSHKITAKCGILCPKTLLLTEKQFHAIQFFCSDSQCLPPGDPKILCAKREYPITGKSFIHLLY